jgi:hypothetical protein
MKFLILFLIVILTWIGFAEVVMADVEEFDNSFKFQAGLDFGGFKDFVTDAASRNSYDAATQHTTPSFQSSQTHPTGYQEFSVEKTSKIIPLFDIKLPSFMELGLPLSIFPADNYTLTTSFNNFNDKIVLGILGFGLGLNARFFFDVGPCHLFISGGPVLAPVLLTYNETQTSAGNTGELTGDAWSVPLGGQGQVGVDWHLDDGFVVSVFGGYRSLVASNFETALIGSGALTGFAGQFDMTSTSYGSMMGFGPQNMTTSTQRPLNVDLTAISMGFQVSLYY